MKVRAINKCATAGNAHLPRATALVAMTVSVSLMGLCAEAATVTVAGNANIFAAGRSTLPAPGGGSGGTFPTAIAFAPGQGQAFRFSSVTGTNTLTVALGYNGPDGAPYSTDLNSYEGISGVRADVAGFLVGVFLGSDEPTNPAPPRLDFTTNGLGSTFVSLAPEIGQTFFIGDGLGSAPSIVQDFIVPPTATRLFLGFADAFAYTGDPGQYQDNGGLLTVTNDISSVLAIYPAVEITWMSQTGSQYQVQWTPQLNPTSWTNLGDPVPGSGLTNSAFDSTRNNVMKHYRVIVQ